MVFVPDEQLLIGWIAFVVLVGFLPGSINGRSREGYSELKQPSFAPPPWLFGVAWTILYALMGVAAYLVQIEGGFFVVGVNRLALVLFLALQVVLAAWSFVFSGRQRLGLSVVVVLVGLVLSIVVGVLFASLSTLAAVFVFATSAWLAFASILAYSLFALNRKRCRKPKSVGGTKRTARV